VILIILAGIALYLLSTLFTVHFMFPSARHYTAKFYKISYYNARTAKFALGWDDIFFIFYWIIVFTGMRAFVMTYILTPLAAGLGIEKKKAKTRFAEQAWILIYPGVFWSIGMYIMYNSDYWLNLRGLWKNWPIREMDGLAKWYYLVQFAFWLQQIAVVNIEERRKDHWQMFTHHIITCTLIFASYGYHQTRVGNLILCLMDIVDLFLPLAKILKYLGYKLPCDIAFGVFMVTWLAFREVGYMWTCWSVYAHIPQEIQYGCYRGGDEDLQGPLPVPNDWSHLAEPFRDPVGLVCWNNNIKWGFLLMLLALQMVLLVWFTMILKVAYRVLSGQGADDVRSDDEDDDDDEEEEELARTELLEKVPAPMETLPLLEKEVLSTDANANFSFSKQTTKRVDAEPSPVQRSSRKKTEGNGHSSGVNLLAHKERKELLGRIGCDKSVAAA
jgi:acyl-CoA-dependent ceramide synthase